MVARRMLSGLALGLGLLVAMHWGLSRMPVDAHAFSATLYVDGKFGDDGGMLDPNKCINPSKPCKTIQHAVDEATRGGRILVTSGTYNDLHQRESVTQVVYLYRSVTIEGGYDADFSRWNPASRPTTLDARGEGRVIYIPEDVTPTLKGLHITNGATDASGGGIFATDSAPRIDGCWIYSNTAGSHGGGVLLNETVGAALIDCAIHHNQTGYSGGAVGVWGGSDVVLDDNDIYENSEGGILIYDVEGATVTDNDVYENRAHTGDGGGLEIEYTPSGTVTGNRVSGNTAGRDGGGIYIYDSDDTLLEDNVLYRNASGSSGGGLSTGSIVTLISNEIFSNTAHDAGGGVHLVGNDHATLIDNTIYSNTARGGGGVSASYSPGIALIDNSIYGNRVTPHFGGGIDAFYTRITVTRSIIRNNVAGHGGGGLFGNGSAFRLVNSIVAGNQITGTGAGICAADTRVDLLHTTLARNEGGDGSGIWLKWTSRLSSTNTILVGHTVGITAAEGTTATLEGTLWGDGAWANEADWAGEGTITTGTVNIWGDPRFVDPENGDYHIGAGAAVGAGVEAGLTDDIDGESRPAPGGTRPDIGADEIAQLHVFLPSLLRDS